MMCTREKEVWGTVLRRPSGGKGILEGFSFVFFFSPQYISYIYMFSRSIKKKKNKTKHGRIFNFGGLKIRKKSSAKRAAADALPPFSPPRRPSSLTRYRRGPAIVPGARFRGTAAVPTSASATAAVVRAGGNRRAAAVSYDARARRYICCVPSALPFRRAASSLPRGC